MVFIKRQINVDVASCFYTTSHQRWWMFLQRHINVDVDVTSWRCIDIRTTWRCIDMNMTFYKRHVPAWIKQENRNAHFAKILENIVLSQT